MTNIHSVRVATLKTPERFAAHLKTLGVELPFDAVVETGASAPLAQAYRLGERVVGNRFCIQPMEGWDGETNGNPSELTRRRWQNFGRSGAKLIWGGIDFVGLGRMVLAYPEMPADVLAGKPLRTKLVCRTFSDCTTGPRNGLVSGCFPLDPFYKLHPEHELVKEAKQRSPVLA